MGKEDLWAMCSKQDKNYKALAWEVGIMISDIISQEMPPPYVPPNNERFNLPTVGQEEVFDAPRAFQARRPDRQSFWRRLGGRG